LASLRLTNLSLAYNRIESIQDCFGDSVPSLTRLNLGGNRLATLPVSLVDLGHLHVLDVSFNRLSVVPMAYSLAARLIVGAKPHRNLLAQQYYRQERGQPAFFNRPLPSGNVQSTFSLQQLALSAIPSQR